MVMDTRASYYFGAMSVAWAALGLFQLISYSTRYSVPLSSALVALFSGLIVGAVSSAAVSLRQLRGLAAKGETKIRLVTWLFMIGAVFIALGVSLFVIGESMETLRLAWDFAYIVSISFPAVRALLFFNWEQKHKCVILFASVFSSKMYVFPRIDGSAVQ